ncbi:YpmS family protein [Mangrovibacillus cuniculi]|uniref:YpmS family protein n=1 Tax=Mangrovibacillus cuniculi TaxID=2593652 RepID=A0A7S8CAZ8_9BACI|nr:YpmS family protein [Mangrovibacillus cuniculi]QPC46617.1 YpmS family protein [Mangrovibacillus cuniculi]
MNKKRSPWAFAFWILLALNMVAILFLFFSATSTKSNFISAPSSAKVNGTQFNISLNKVDLNKLIDHTLSSQDWAVGEIEYDIEIEDAVKLKGEVPVFSSTIQMQVDFIPEAQENGDVVLQADDLQVGGLKVPISYIMGYIDRQYEFPEWVRVMPSENIIYVALSEHELKNGTKVKASSIDLSKENQEFTIELPK